MPYFISLFKHPYSLVSLTTFKNDSIYIEGIIPFENFDDSLTYSTPYLSLSFDNSKTSEYMIDENLLNAASYSYYKSEVEYGFSFNKSELIRMAEANEEIKSAIESLFNPFENARNKEHHSSRVFSRQFI